MFESNGEEREIVMTEMDATMEKLLPLLFLGMRHEAGCSDKELESEMTKYKVGIGLGKRPSLVELKSPKNSARSSISKREEKLALSKARYLLVLGGGKYFHLAWEAGVV